MVDAFLRKDFARFKRIPFTRFLLRFADGSTLELRPSELFESNDRTGTLTLTRANATPHVDQVDLRSPEADTIAAQTQYLKPHHSLPDTWIDVRDGKTLSPSDVLSQFANDPDATWPGLAGLLQSYRRLADGRRVERLPWLDPSRQEDRRNQGNRYS